LLQQQIRLAGFSETNDDGERLFFGRPVFACAKGFKDEETIKKDFSALECADTGTANPTLAVRYQATLLNSQKVVDSGTDRPANCAYKAITAWTPGTAEGGLKDVEFALADNRYFIQDDKNNNNTPTLYCAGREGATVGTAEALIPGIESMDLKFGVTLPPTADSVPHQITAYLTADEVDALAPTDLNLAWARVAAVRICLLARSAQPVPLGNLSADDVGSYRDCTGDTQTGTDRFLRRAYVTTIFLRNMRPAVPSAFSSTGTGAEAAVANPWAYLTPTEE